MLSFLKQGQHSRRSSQPAAKSIFSTRSTWETEFSHSLATPLPKGTVGEGLPGKCNGGVGLTAVADASDGRCPTACRLFNRAIMRK